MRSAHRAVLRTFKNIPAIFVGLAFCSCKASIHHIHVNKGRFISQVLLDETALLSCMAYVDLNPIRAGMEDDLVNSDFTPIQQRLFDYVKRKPVKNEAEKNSN